MIYGLYLSATGVLTNSYRQDVIANNLANSETVGFKRDLATFVERRAAVQENGGKYSGDPRMARLAGGLWALPTRVDNSQGEPENGEPTDMCIAGDGYFQVQTAQGARLTRDGRFTLDSAGHLVMNGNPNNKVLDDTGKPVVMDPRFPFEVGKQGEITQEQKLVGRIGVYAADPKALHKDGANLLSYSPDTRVTAATNYNVRQGFVERSNVEPSLELTQLMDAQRQLEANANMIRYQDQTLQRLVNDVAKIA
jgi:flagellar basal body rod protein FlgG